MELKHILSSYKIADGRHTALVTSVGQAGKQSNAGWICGTGKSEVEEQGVVGSEMTDIIIMFAHYVPK